MPASFTPRCTTQLTLIGESPARAAASIPASTAPEPGAAAAHLEEDALVVAVETHA